MKQKYPNTKPFLLTAKRAALQGGRILLKEFKKGKLGTINKGVHDLVNKADFLSEERILKILKRKYPKHAYLAEETGKDKTKSDYFWLVDPLDGSVNFAMRNPMFSVSIALAYKGEVIMGVVYFPLLNKIFTAEKGKGAYLNNKKIKVSKKKTVNDSLITFCGGVEKKVIKRTIKLYQQFKSRAIDARQLGSAAIELAYVAAGYTEAIILPGTNPWDVAAGVLLVREAGGKVTTFNNKEWTLKDKTVVATNGLIHQETLKILKSK